MPGLVPNDTDDIGLCRGFLDRQAPADADDAGWFWGLMPGLVPNDADDVGLRRGCWTDRLALMLMMLAGFGG